MDPQDLRNLLDERNAKYRVNPLTNVPGGVTLLFEFSDGRREAHPRIKYTHKYVDRVASDCRAEGRELVRATVKESGKIIYELKK